MKLIMLATLIFLTIAPCSGRKSHRWITGTDLSSILKSRELCLFYGLSVGSNWSVCAGTSIRLPELNNDDASITHEDDLNTDRYGIPNAAADLIAAQMSAQYWPLSPFQGPVISFGIGTRHSRNLKIPVTIGYVCRIWKGIRVSVIYDIEMLDTIRYGSISGKGICLGLGYEF